MNESPTLPELPAPSLPENDMVRGFVDQSAFGAVPEARLTVVAYAPTTMRVIERPTNMCGRYRLIGSCNDKTIQRLLQFRFCREPEDIDHSSILRTSRNVSDRQESSHALDDSNEALPSL